MPALENLIVGLTLSLLEAARIHAAAAAHRRRRQSLELRPSAELTSAGLCRITTLLSLAAFVPSIPVSQRCC